MKRVWRYMVGAVGLSVFMAGGRVFADGSWTPMITAGSFTGMTADCGTAASGIVGVCLIVLGLGVLMRVLTR